MTALRRNREKTKSKKIDSLQHQIDGNNNRKENIIKTLKVDLLKEEIEDLRMKMQKLLLPILYRLLSNNKTTPDNLNTLLEIMENYIPFSNDQMKGNIGQNV